MSDQHPNPRQHPPFQVIHQNQTITSDLYDPMQQMHIEKNPHQSASPFPHSQQNSLNNHSDRNINIPLFQNLLNLQTTSFNSSSGFYCPHCPHCNSKPDGNSSNNQYHPMRKPEYRGNFQPPQSIPSSNTLLNYEDPLFKPLFEHPSPPTRSNQQHNTFLPTFVPKIPPSLENRNFVYSPNISISPSIRQETQSTSQASPPALSINNPRNSGRNFQYSGTGRNDHHQKRANSQEDYQPPSSYTAEENLQPHNLRSFRQNNGEKLGNKQNHHHERSTANKFVQSINQRNFEFLESQQQPVDLEEFSFKKQKPSDQSNVIDILSDSADEGPQMNLKGLFKMKEDEEREDHNAVQNLIQNFMKSNDDFKKEKEQGKKKEEAEIAKRDGHAKEFAEIISRKNEKAFKDQKRIDQITRHTKFQKDVLKLVKKQGKKPSPKTGRSKQKQSKSTKSLYNPIKFDLFDPSSDFPESLNGKRDFDELGDFDKEKEQNHLDYLEKHFKSETFYEDGLGLERPKRKRKDQEVSCSSPFKSDFCESSGDESESRYFDVNDQEYGIIIECYSNESDFVDIYEVKRKVQDFEIIGQNKENPEEIDELIYPKKTTIHVGEAFQADIPKPAENRPVDHRTFCQRWDPQKLNRESYEDFIFQLSSLLGLAGSKISEQKIIKILVDHDYNVEQALKFCSENLDHVKEILLCK